ncbi:OmpA family protein [Vannielia litorea]|uniref:OmpA family protein n=1 Tax=Vannielia litorea TaxID=1217970 RepID=UPI001C98C18E|nr:OmpA family protein [Vannielia litorea]MBY6152405.1 OmpA family protein [Vannielia litorea]
MSAKFRNTTALVAAISLSIPAVAPAQQVVDRCEAGTIGISAEVADELSLTLTDEQQAALDGGTSSDAVIVSNFDPAAPELCMTVAELEEMGVTEAEVVMAVEAEPTAEELGGEAAAAAEVETEEKGVLEKALDAVTRDDTAEEPAEAEVAAEPEAEVEAEVTAEAEPEMEAEAEATAEAEAEFEPEAEVTAEAEAEPEVEAEAEMETEATAEGDDSGSALQEALNEVTGNDVATPEEAEENTAEAEAEAAPEAEMTAEAEAEAEADAEANPAVPDVVAEIAKAIEAQSAEEADPEEQAAAAETEAPEASAATDETAEAADVEETTVTEESARSSSEEFLDKVTGAKADTSASASASNDDDGGLSDLEKALLVGLGAVVVGKALEGNGDAQVVTKSDDRVVVLEDGRYRVIRDDNELIERPGSTVRRETFQDGSTRTIVTRENGVQIITIRDPELRVLRRIRVDAEGNRTVLIDDTADVEPVDVAALPDPVAEAEVDAGTDAETLRAVLSTKSAADRRFALYQVRNIERVRKLAPAIDLDAINFRTGSAVIDPQEAEELSELGNLIAAYVEENPGEVFLVEGHTDAVGNAAFNLALSDRRAESVALALTEYFDVPPENLVVQGYGESDLKVKTLDDERANRRAAVRRITPLIASGS